MDEHNQYGNDYGGCRFKVHAYSQHEHFVQRRWRMKEKTSTIIDRRQLHPDTSKNEIDD